MNSSMLRLYQPIYTIKIWVHCIIFDDFCKELRDEILDLFAQFLMRPGDHDGSSDSFIPKFGVLIREDEILELSLTDRLRLICIDSAE